MDIIWSQICQLSNYKSSPKVAGLYIVGIYRKGRFSEEDNYLGKNFPDEFEPKYIGISKRSIRSRLSCHYRKRGNKNIKNHINEYGPELLSFTYCEHDVTEAEGIYLEMTCGTSKWNVKKSENGAWRKYIKSL